MKTRTLAATFLMLCSSHASADGALATTPLEHFVFGFTSAYVVDADNTDMAARSALLKCRQSDFEMQSRLPAPIRRDRCKVMKVLLGGQLKIP